MVNYSSEGYAFVWGLPEGYKYLHLFIVMVSLWIGTIPWPEKSVAANVMAGEQGPP
ncbi:uncharacterized protein METZ01_LOCUS211418 [marine metagenome]|uniref:Uncharacterized protein n=1 Tax=marine metagenome TaxID=408172 RepID=A0A382F8A3_9ZZZZ